MGQGDGPVPEPPLDLAPHQPRVVLGEGGMEQKRGGAEVGDPSLTSLVLSLSLFRSKILREYTEEVRVSSYIFSSENLGFKTLTTCSGV